MLGQLDHLVRGVARARRVLAEQVDDASAADRDRVVGEGPIRELDMRVWFRALLVQDSHGRPLPLERFIDGGRRWWHAHNTGELPAISLDVAPRL